MFRKTFDNQGEFKAYYAACDWLKEHNISHGAMCRREPIGLIRGEVLIDKWKNLTAAEKASLDGTMTATDFRNGPVTIQLTTPCLTSHS